MYLSCFIGRCLYSVLCVLPVPLKHHILSFETYIDEKMWQSKSASKTQFVSSRRLKHKFKRVAHTHPCSTLNVHNCVWATDRWLCICVLFISKRTKRLTMQRNAKQIALWVWHKQLKNTHKYTRTLCHYLNRFFFSVFWKETTEVFWHEIRISATEVWSEIRNMNASTCSK